METVLKSNQAGTKYDDEILVRMLDRGIDDMETGRELPIEKAFEKITELRNMHIYNI